MGERASSRPSDGSHQRRARWLVPAVVGVAVGALVGAAAVWSATMVFVPPSEGLDESEFATVQVVEGEVGSSISAPATASWPTTPVAMNAAAGVVTTIDVAAGDEVVSGQRLYTVGLRPTVVASGTVPAFGTIAPGDRGAQVGQLQRFLQEGGYWASAITDVYSPSFESAVRQWQRTSGFPVDGVVQQGDIVWVPQLPARLVLDADLLRVGASVGGGEPLVLQLPAAPRFTVQLQVSQAASAPTGTAVEVSAPDGTTWDAITADQSPRDDGTVDVTLTAPDGGAVCGETCAQVSLAGETSLETAVAVIPLQSGLVVPIAAVTTDAAGATAVVGEDGTVIPVVVVVSARGMAIVEGVDEGETVRLFGNEEPQ